MYKELNKTLFTFDDEVRNKLTNEKGIIASIHYESPEFYTYTVLYATGAERARESELIMNEKLNY